MRDQAERDRTGNVSPWYNREAMLALSHGAEYQSFLSSAGVRLRPRVERALALAKIEPGMMVLDVGCGKGEVVLRCLQAGANVVGSDCSTDCLELTSSTLSQITNGGYTGVHLVRADAKTLPFADGVFDRIFLLDVVEHFHDCEAKEALRELARVSSESGLVIVHTVPNRWALTVGYPLIRMIFRSLPKQPRSRLESQVHVNEQSIPSLHRLLCSAGFSSSVWVDGTIGSQADWNRANELGHEARNTVYSILRGRLMRGLYRIVMRSPLKLFLANDIYAIAWKGSLRTRERKFGFSSRMESLVASFGRLVESLRGQRSAPVSRSCFAANGQNGRSKQDRFGCDNGQSTVANQKEAMR